MGVVDAPVRCETWRFDIAYSRGPQRVQEQIRPQLITGGKLSWKRQFGDNEGGRAIVNLICCEGIEQIVDRAHSIVAHRGNRRRLFVGPIEDVAARPGIELIVPARDISRWLDYWAPEVSTSEASGAAAQMAEAAFAANQVEALVEWRPHGWDVDRSGSLVSTVMSQSPVRWAVWGDNLWIGPHPFAVSQQNRLRITDWEEPPLVSRLSSLLTDVETRGGRFRVSDPGQFGRVVRVESEAGDPEQTFLAATRPATGATYGGRAWQVSLASSDGGVTQVSLRQGVQLDWGTLVPGGLLRVDGFDACGIDVPGGWFEVTELTVEFGEGGRENMVGISLAEWNGSLG